eukprot:178492-Hanusia_phi.AAC.4
MVGLSMGLDTIISGAVNSGTIRDVLIDSSCLWVEGLRERPVMRVTSLLANQGQAAGLVRRHFPGVPSAIIISVELGPGVAKLNS